MQSGTRGSCRKQHCLPNVPGKVCFLCGKSAPYMTKFSNWKEPEQSFVMKHCNRTIPIDSDICKKDHLEAVRYHSSPSFIPKWKRALYETETIRKCAYQYCIVTSDNENLIRPSFESPSVICSHLHVNTTDFDSLYLCHKHYTIHRALNPLIPCASCVARPKAGQSFNRHSLDALLVNTHFHNVFQNVTEDIQMNDVLCYSCYRMHLLIIKNLEEQKIGSDQQLQEDIDFWSGKYNNTTEEPTRSTLHTVITVANYLLQNRALLLPVSSKLFISSYSSDSSQTDINLDLGDYTIKFSSRWLLNQLIVYLHTYMDYKCIHRKYGTVLFRKNGNLLHSLSWALGTYQDSNTSEVESFLPTSNAETSTSILEKAGVIINNLIHEESKKMKSLYLCMTHCHLI